MKYYRNKFGNALHLEQSPDGVRFNILTKQGLTQAVTLPTDILPKVLIGILDEAGLEGKFHPAYDSGTPEHLEQIVGELGTYIERRDEIAAEQAEQKKLEEEALELANAMLELQCYELFPDKEFIPIASWDGKQSGTREKWLAVARKARELGAKK